MGEVNNFDDKSIKALVKSFPMEPMFTRVIITLNKEKDDESGLILSDNSLSEVQYVVSAGGSAQVKPGQKILLDIEKMTVKVPNPENSHEQIETIKVDPILVEGNMYAIIYDNQIKCKFTK